jgi:membrane-associated phospholipid phosphatase
VRSYILTVNEAKTSIAHSYLFLLVVTGAFAITAISLSFAAHWISPFPGDLKLTLLFQSYHGRWLLSFMKWVSYLGGGWQSALLAIACCLILFCRLGTFKAVLGLAAWFSTALSSVFKLMVGSPRPSDSLVHVLAVEQSNGFPSGHAFYAMAFLGLLVYFVLSRIHQPVLRSFLSVILVVLIISIGASRVYLGVHWPSDVLGGYLCGAVSLGICIYIDIRKTTTFRLQQRPANKTI